MFTNTLPQKAKEALAVLGKSKPLPENTYLAGGSALALQFGHRISVDFDFFTSVHFSPKKIAENLQRVGKFTVDETTEDTLLGNFEDVRFSLFRYQYPLVSPTTNLQGIEIAAPEDIAGMKLAAIMDRGTKKDFVDLFFITQKGVPFENCLIYYDQKYQALGSNIYSIIKSLTYFVDAEESQMPTMLEKVSWKQIEKYFEKEAIKLAQKYL